MNTLTAKAETPKAEWLETAFSAGKKNITGMTDVAAVVVPAVFILGTAALESVQTGYSRVTDTVSMLVWGSNGWWQNILFCLNGLFLLLFALRLYKPSRDLAGKAGVTVLALAGVSFFIIALCPTLAPGTEPSFSSRVHEYTARGLSAIFPLACLLLALSWRRNPTYRAISNWTLAFGAAGLVLNAIGLLYVTGELKWIGALERLIILNGFAWLAVVGLYFCHTSHRMHVPHRAHIGSESMAYRICLVLKYIAVRLLPEPRVPVYSRDGQRRVISCRTGSADNIHITGRLNEHIYKR